MEWQKMLRRSLDLDRTIFNNICVYITDKEMEIPQQQIRQKEVIEGLLENIRSPQQEEIQRLIKLIRDLDNERKYFREQCINILETLMQVECDEKQKKQRDFNRFINKNMGIHLELCKVNLQKQKDINQLLIQENAVLNNKIGELTKNLGQTRDMLKSFICGTDYQQIDSDGVQLEDINYKINQEIESLKLQNYTILAKTISLKNGKNDEDNYINKNNNQAMLHIPLDLDTNLLDTSTSTNANTAQNAKKKISEVLQTPENKKSVRQSNQYHQRTQTEHASTKYMNHQKDAKQRQSQQNLEQNENSGKKLTQTKGQLTTSSVSLALDLQQVKQHKKTNMNSNSNIELIQSTSKNKFSQKIKLNSSLLLHSQTPRASNNSVNEQPILVSSQRQHKISNLNNTINSFSSKIKI